MPIDSSHVGRGYPRTAPHLITREEIDAFAAALGAPTGGDAPVTFAMTLAATAWQQLFDDAELGLALERTVHVDQAFDVVRPLRVGDAATAQLRIDKVRSRATADMVGVVVDVAVDGKTVCTATSTFLCSREAAA